MEKKTNMVSFRLQRKARRELVVIAVMSAIAILSRSLFAMLPQVKPMAAVIIITGATCGKRAGGITGAASAILSNFLFGQGIWTIWQMIGFGLVGLLAGFFHSSCFNQDVVCLKKHVKTQFVLIVIYGFVAVTFLYGWIVDTGTALIYTRPLTFQMMIPTYVAGFPFNLIHGCSTAVFLFVMYVPIEKKIDRIKIKYGVFCSV